MAETQPFIDGNKRTALISMLTFLELNGFSLSATDQELAGWMIAFSSGSTPEQIAERLCSRTCIAAAETTWAVEAPVGCVDVRCRSRRVVRSSRRGKRYVPK
jgi:hypothetical protein